GPECSTIRGVLGQQGGGAGRRSWNQPCAPACQPGVRSRPSKAERGPGRSGTVRGMSSLEVREVRGLWGRRLFVGVPFRIQGGDPEWVPPLRLSVYDRLSPRHPAMRHQQVALWVACRRGRPVGRIGACVDDSFNEYQGVRWGWIGFFDAFDDPQVAGSL